MLTLLLMALAADPVSNPVDRGVSEALARERAALKRERVRLNRLESELETRTEASGADARFKPSWPQNG
jgi:hypothetical protein